MNREKSRMHFRDRRRQPGLNFYGDLVDRISTLPDSILSIILSFLPTMEAVATSVLSKRWKFVWVTVHNLDFYYNGSLKGLNEGDNMKFVQFVNRVLLLHDVGFLNKFSLLWHPQYISSHVSSWISYAIAKNLHDLSLSIQTSHEPFEMPISGCDSLRSLELEGAIYVSAAIAVCFPRLESLKLVSVNVESEESFEKLISGCSMLKYLCLGCFCIGDDVFTCIISSVSLIRLEIDIGYGGILKLNASSLEYLEVKGGISDIFVQKNLSSLIEARLRISLDYDFPNNSLVEAIRAFDCAKSLTLCADSMRALSRATITLSTEFKRLVKLETFTYCCDCIALQDFIQCSDNLEVLTISKEWTDYDLDDHEMWTTPVEVPRCLSNSLEVVVIKGYHHYFYDEREMIRYMLKHGSALKAMQISCRRPRLNDSIVRYLSEFSISSPDCYVHLS